jgi:trigger factor
LKSTVERTPESEAVLTVTLEWAELEKAADRAYKELALRYAVPGFRKGHAPRSMLERMLGKDTIYQEGLEHLVESSYRDALREHDLTPVAQPTVDTPPLEQGQPYTYTATVPILVPPTLGDYRAIRVATPSAEVSDEEVEHQLEHMKEDAAEWRPLERAAQVDDQVTMDLKLTVDDKIVSDYKDNPYVLAIERPGIFAGMDDHIVGKREGESATFETTIPEDYANPALAGKTGHYEVTLKAVKERVLPELDDEFAKTVGEAETLDGLRATLRERLERQKQTDARRELREQVAKAVTDQAQIAVHPAMVADEADAMLRETTRVLGQNRLSLEQYLQIMGKSEDEYRAEIEPEARERVKRDLVLAAVADAEGIEVSDTDIAGWLQVLNALGGKPMRPQDLSAAQRASIRSRMRRDRALDRMVEIATEGKGAGEAESESSEPETELATTAASAPAEAQASTETQGASTTVPSSSATQASSATQGEAKGAPAATTAEAAAAPAGSTTAGSTTAGSTTAGSTTAGSTTAGSTGQVGAGKPAGGEREQPVIRAAQEAARLGAELGAETPAGSAAETVEQRPESAQTPKSSETQALSGSGTEVPKSGA